MSAHRVIMATDAVIGAIDGAITVIEYKRTVHLGIIVPWPGTSAFCVESNCAA
jgi:hypothetical protein